jgi:galactokinase
MYETLVRQFENHFGHAHTVSAYAPGRVEVLGNHTDYNEGYVLSAAINFGTYFLVSPSEDSTCRIVAGDLMAEVSFDVSAPNPVSENTWANYVIGVLAGLQGHGETGHGFNGMFLGNIPLGAGLSSSAALEMCTGLALGKLYGIEIDKLEMAKIGQKAEHEHAGVKCGLLDQVSSLFGAENALVMTDFRSLEVETLRMGDDAAFLMCNTKAKHALADGEYNERREHCEQAAAYFKDALDRPVSALRDVSWAEWEAHAPQMDPMTARRAAHPIGEDERVLEGRKLLDAGDLDGFGRLMFESHDSSVNYFENSCEELDTIVNAAKEIPEVLGARLSGGGFGGSVVALIHPHNAETASVAINTAFERAHGHPCDISVITPSKGAHLVG